MLSRVQTDCGWLQLFAQTTCLNQERTMQAERTYNVNVISQDLLLTPAEIKSRLPITPRAEEFVLQSRATLQRILDRQDPRLFIIVGPCSIHDLHAAHDYAQRLKQLATAVEDTLFI